MIFSIGAWIKIIPLVLAITGFFVAKHIRHHKKTEKPLVCPMRMNCDAVVHSDYSKFFGVPVEVLGMTYYATISVLYLVLLVLPMGPVSSYASIAVFLLSASAVIFSIYLTFLQLFVIKEGCFWCFMSAIISILIFVIPLFFWLSVMAVFN